MADRVRITASSGRVRVVGEAHDDVAVEGATMSGAGAEIEVRGDSGPVRVRVPVGTDVVVGSNSGNVELTGTLGAASVTTVSADVEAEDVASIDARTGSGKLTVTTSRGTVRLRTNSAKVRVGRADGELLIGAVSSSVKIGEARGAVSVKTVSGDIEVLITGTDPAALETISGKIKVRVPAGVRPDVWLRTTSGKRRVEPEAGSDLVIKARSLSGNISVERA